MADPCIVVFLSFIGTLILLSRPRFRTPFAVMFFRFGCAVLLVVLVSVTGVVLETENLALRRALSHQHYQMEILRNRYARLRLKTQQMGAPERLMQAVDAGQITRPESKGGHEPSVSGRAAFRESVPPKQ